MKSFDGGLLKVLQSLFLWSITGKRHLVLSLRLVFVDAAICDDHFGLQFKMALVLLRLVARLADFF